MTQLDETLSHIHDILKRNRIHEIVLIIGIGSLFLLGIASFVVALVRGEYIWSVPPAVATFFLRWPIRQLQELRNRNIALASAPIFVSQLTPAQAAKEIQKILERLFDDRGGRR